MPAKAKILSTYHKMKLILSYQIPVALAILWLISAPMKEEKVSFC
jgi:hypothetical protein